MSDSQGDIQGADKYLRAFSKSPEAWGICMNVLLAHPEDKAITFHMLRTLKCKVLYDFSNVFTYTKSP
jgi:transportin-3